MLMCEKQNWAKVFGACNNIPFKQAACVVRFGDRTSYRYRKQRVLGKTKPHVLVSRKQAFTLHLMFSYSPVLIKTCSYVFKNMFFCSLVFQKTMHGQVEVGVVVVNCCQLTFHGDYCCLPKVSSFRRLLAASTFFLTKRLLRFQKFYVYILVAYVFNAYLCKQYMKRVSDFRFCI